MANQKNLTPSNIRYLLAMKQLDKNGSGVRSVDIATCLGLSRPSVHNMMKTLIEMGFIRKTAYGVAFLTEEGEQTARRYGKYYLSVSEFLRDGFPGLKPVCPAVFALLAEIPETDLEKLCDSRQMSGEVTV